MGKRRFITFVAIALSVVAWLIVNAILEARRELGDTMRYASLFKIKYALRIYASETNSLPPVFQVDDGTGTRTSWRVLLELHEQDSGSRIYREYDTALAWNNDKNLKAASEFGIVPYDLWEPITIGPEGVPHTQYAAISGDDALLAKDHSISLDEIADGPENTLVVIEILNSDIPWSEPKDLELSKLDQSRRYLTKPETPDGQFGFEGQYLLFADLEIFKVLRPMPVEDFRALVTPNGGEPTTRQQLVDSGHIAPH